MPSRAAAPRRSDPRPARPLPRPSRDQPPPARRRAASRSPRTTPIRTCAEVGRPTPPAARRPARRRRRTPRPPMPRSRPAPTAPAARNARRRLGLGREPFELTVDPVLGDRVQVGVDEQFERLGLDLETESRRVASRAQCPGRIVDERAGRAGPAAGRRSRSSTPTVAVDQRARGRDRDGERVDGEVAPREVLLDSGGSHLRQRSRAADRPRRAPSRCRSSRRRR